MMGQFCLNFGSSAADWIWTRIMLSTLEMDKLITHPVDLKTFNSAESVLAQHHHSNFSELAILLIEFSAFALFQIFMEEDLKFI